MSLGRPRPAQSLGRHGRLRISYIKHQTGHDMPERSFSDSAQGQFYKNRYEELLMILHSMASDRQADPDSLLERIREEINARITVKTVYEFK